MSNNINVAVYPCGSEIGLEINSALREDKYISLFGINSTSSHGRYVYKNYKEPFPFPSDEDFVPTLNAYIEENSIDFLLSSNDDAGLFLAEHRDEIACRVLIAATETCRIIRSKVKTYSHFADCSFVPRIYLPHEITSTDFPLFVKPDIGQGSEGIAVLHDIDDLQRLLKSGISYSIAELLVGSEYTVDCFTDGDGNLLVTSMRERVRTKSGISVSGRIVDMPSEVQAIAEVLNDRLSFYGVWFFQVKQNSSGAFKLLEAAPRVAGTMGESRVRGFNFVRNTINLALGYAIKVISNDSVRPTIDRALISRYELDFNFEYVYLDFDDVLINGEQVNPLVIALIYQFRNAGKKIILLSRHDTDLVLALTTYNIDVGLFEEVHWLTRDEKKSDYIKHKDAIFIDDSFGERLDVYNRTKIPVFDVDSLESLVDWRR